jgi:parallel beta-helix repeat protein
MKIRYIIIAFILLTGNISFAANKYFSSTGNDITGDGSINNPYQSITKLNAIFSTLSAGDSVLLKRGGTWYGTITVNKSGAIGNPITIGAYGTGENPVITGFTTISGWVNEGGGIYSKIITSAAQTNMVTVDGMQYAMGRYPDASFLTYESFATNVSITDNGLGTSTNWTGAEIAIRKNDWTIDRCNVTNHSGDILTYTSLASTQNASTGFGYFFQNDLRTLTTYGEWYHNFSTGKFYMYFGVVDPNTKIIQVATLNNNVYNNGLDYIDIENLKCIGSIASAINLRYNHINCNIKNNTVKFSGAKGIVMLGGSTNCLISNNNVSYCHSVGVDNGDTQGCTVEYNNIYGIGLLTGQSLTPDNGIGISSYQSAGQSLIQYNTIRATGYNGITMWRYGACIVQYNRIDSTCMVLDDGGAIYTSGAMTRHPRIIRGNIISNSVGNSLGTLNSTSTAAGIYLDETAANVQVLGNTVFDINYSGIKFHKAQNDTIWDNTVYNCLRGIGIEDYVGNQIRNHSIRRNTFFAKTASQYPWYSRVSSTDANLFGTADSNCYARPINDNNVFSIQQGVTTVLYNLNSWRAYTNQDINSRKSAKIIADVSEIDFQYNATSIPVLYSFTGYKKIGSDGTLYNNIAIMQPYTSKIFINDGNTETLNNTYYLRRKF